MKSIYNKITLFTLATLILLPSYNAEARSFWSNLRHRGTAQSRTPASVATPTPTPAPVVTAPPVASTSSASLIILGVNGHDGRSTYPMSEAEARFKLLDAKNLRSYRFDVDPRNFAVLDQLIGLAKKYKITLRPMVYSISTDANVVQSSIYTVAKRYANDIKVWELNNEQDSSKSGAQDRINVMVAMYKGVMQASDEMKAGLKTTINVMSCNSDDMSATARCPGDKNGSMWFLDMAKASGFNFDYISFHYYPYYGDKGYWYTMYLTQLKNMSIKYNTKIFYNEMNCAEIYKGNTDGGYAGDKGCYDSLKQLVTELNTNYASYVQEVNMYELLDQPDMGDSDAEAHFGLMYNLNSAKPLLDLVSGLSKK